MRITGCDACVRIRVATTLVLCACWCISTDSCMCDAVSVLATTGGAIATAFKIHEYCFAGCKCRYVKSHVYLRVLVYCTLHRCWGSCGARTRLPSMCHTRNSTMMLSTSWSTLQKTSRAGRTPRDALSPFVHIVRNLLVPLCRKTLMLACIRHQILTHSEGVVGMEA
jgi:hypothetical protein